MAIAIIVIVAMLVIILMIKAFIDLKRITTILNELLDYLDVNYGYKSGSLFQAYNYKVFLYADKKQEKFCEIIWNPENPTSRVIKDFQPNKIFFPLMRKDILGFGGHEGWELFVKERGLNVDPHGVVEGFAIDENNMKIYFLKLSQKGFEYKTKNFSDLLSSEIVADGVTVTKTSRTSQAGSALLGGILFGGAGAIVGGLTGKKTSSQELDSLTLRLITNDMDNPVRNYLLNARSMKKNPELQKQVEKTALHWHSVMQIIIKRADAMDGDKV